MKNLAILLGFVLALLLGVQQAHVQPYDGNAYARFQVYVSSVSFGGIPVGSDGTCTATGQPSDGSPLCPYLTVDKGINVTPVGGTTLLNGDPASPTTYTTATMTAGVSVTYSLAAVNTSPTPGAILAGTGTSTIITMAARGNLTLANLILDPSMNSGGAANQCIAFPQVPVAQANLTTTNVIFQNWTTDCIFMPTVGRQNITLNSTTFTADNARSCLFGSFNTGNLVANVGSCTLTHHSDANVGFGGFVVTCSTTAPTVTITDFSVMVTLTGGLSVNGFHYGMAFSGCNNSSLTGSSPTQSQWPLLAVFDPAPGGGAQGIGFTFQGTVGIPTSNNDTVHNYRCTIQAGNGGNCGKMGTDGVPGAIPRFTGLAVNGYHVENSQQTVAAGLHGIECGYTDGCEVQNLTSDTNGCGLCFVDKESINTFWHDNEVWVGSSGAGMLPKGAVNSRYVSNIIHINATGAAASCSRTESDNIAPFTNSTGITFDGNICSNEGGTSTVMMNVNPSNTATFGGTTGNTYSNPGPGGSLSGTPFLFQSITYALCSLWQAAQETNATCNFP